LCGGYLRRFHGPVGQRYEHDPCLHPSYTSTSCPLFCTTLPYYSVLYSSLLYSSLYYSTLLLLSDLFISICSMHTTSFYHVIYRVISLQWPSIFNHHCYPYLHYWSTSISLFSYPSPELSSPLLLSPFLSSPLHSSSLFTPPSFQPSSLTLYMYPQSGW
jgi:hypothetical protein